MRSRQLHRITITMRSLVLLAAGAPILWDRDLEALVGLFAVGAIYLVIEITGVFPRVEAHHSTTLEAAVVGTACAFSLHTTAGILAVLVVAPGVAGFRRGLAGVALALSAQTVAVVAWAAVLFGDLTTDESIEVFTWTISGLGAGLIANFVRATIVDPPDEMAAYLDAQKLIRQLIDISGGLGSGLDVDTLSGQIVSAIRDELPTTAIGLYRPAGETLIPLVTRATESQGDLSRCEGIAIETWARTEPVVYQGTFAFLIGEQSVVAGVLARTSDLTTREIDERIDRISEGLGLMPVQLDTALLFADFRDSASADVRKRLAREMHDGVAQDIASLGYLVDALAAKPATDKQAEQFAMLRDRITKVVAEVRQSVLTLRTSIGESQSLGAAISTLARHLSESSGLPIQVTLDEHATRLRPEVEAELFRIAQEAMNNVLKHAQATRIDVSCQVYPPAARITVTDDGRGLQKGRSDSHGLKIMKERARLVGGKLDMSEHDGGGLVVSVVIGDLPQETSSADAPSTATVVP